MTKNSLKAGLAAAIAAGSIFAAPVQAAEQEAATVEVRYSDLNLSTEEGQRTLERRLNRAAEEVCGIDNRSGAALRSNLSRRCYAETVRSFDRQVAMLVEREARGG